MKKLIILGLSILVSVPSYGDITCSAFCLKVGPTIQSDNSVAFSRSLFQTAKTSKEGFSALVKECQNIDLGKTWRNPEGIWNAMLVSSYRTTEFLQIIEAVQAKPSTACE